MADYNLMYKKLFNAVTDAVNILQAAQFETEEIFINHDPNNVVLFKPNGVDGEQHGGDDDENM